MSHCKPENKRKGLLGRTSGRHCSLCNFRVRGNEHYEGSHHQKAAVKMKDVV